MLKLIVLLLLSTLRSYECQVMSDGSDRVSRDPGTEWTGLLASAILASLKRTFGPTPDASEPLRVESSPAASLLGDLIRFHNAVIYSRFRRDYEGSVADDEAVNPKEEVEIIDAATELCADCDREGPKKSVCPPEQGVGPGGGCAPPASESPARYLVRVPHQCPTGYKSHRGVCHLVW